MAKLTFEGDVDDFVVSFDGKEAIRYPQKTADISIEENETHVIQWFVIGAPSTEYKIKVSEPKIVLPCHLVAMKGWGEYPLLKKAVKQKGGDQ